MSLSCVVFLCFPFLCVKADDIEFDAQVPAAISSGSSQRHPQAALQHVSHLCLQGDGIHRRHGLSKWKGKQQQPKRCRGVSHYVSIHIGDNEWLSSILYPNPRKKIHPIIWHVLTWTRCRSRNWKSITTRSPRDSATQELANVKKSEFCFIQFKK